MGICDQPGHGGAVVLRHRPARIVEGQPEGGYTGAFEIICCCCGDHPHRVRAACGRLSDAG